MNAEPRHTTVNPDDAYIVRGVSENKCEACRR